MKKSRRTYNGVHLNKKSNTQDVVEQSLTIKQSVYTVWNREFAVMKQSVRHNKTKCSS